MGISVQSVALLLIAAWAMILQQQRSHVFAFPIRPPIHHQTPCSSDRQQYHIISDFSYRNVRGYSPLQRASINPRNHGMISYSVSTALHMSRWRGTEDVQGADVLKSCIPYLLPLLDGEHFGKYIYQQVPPLGFLDSLFIGPLSEFYNRVPFLGLILFVALTLGTRMNTDMNWNVRFNAQQAALIDVILVFPELIGSAFEGEDLPRYIEAPCMNFVWYTYMAMVLYSVYSNVVLQKRPDQIPWISAYAITMTGPI